MDSHIAFVDKIVSFSLAKQGVGLAFEPFLM